MLRTFKPLNHHSIFIFHQQVEHLVCNVWCRAASEIPCQSLLTQEFEIFYKRTGKGIWIKNSVDEIYELCKPLSPEERALIREAFYINNEIESFCEARSVPIKLDDLPEVVKKMGQLLVRYYKDLIPAKLKLDYYNQLIEHNGNMKFCNCCGLTPIENKESRYREDNDHYLPKEEFPFASVNFTNLPPLCSKCNKKCKTTKNPFKDKRKSFFPFKPLSSEFEINVSINAKESTSYLALNDDEISLIFNNDADKVSTWHWLFEINERYNEEIRQFSKTELRMLANRFKRNEDRKKGETYKQILDDAINDYELDKYDDRKFLKKSFLQEMLNKPDWMGVYGDLIY